MKTFTHSADTVFAEAAETQLRSEIARVRNLLRRIKYIPALIGGYECFSEECILAENPSCSQEVFGEIACAGEREAERAISIIRMSPDVARWKHSSLSKRSRVIDAAADLIELERLFFIALMVLEVGKHPEDADKEVSEAVDLLRLYAAEARAHEEAGAHDVVSPAGEKNTVRLGPAEEPAICLSIQPWNFPLAISAGPMAAALLSGYSVLYKPAEESSIIGYFLAKLMYQAGVPFDALHFLPGRGETIGAYLVSHKDVKGICFTGSSAVGRKIERAVSEFNLDILPTLPRKERYRKRIMTMETGGNNALIIDSSAERTEWLRAVLRSGFSFAGQKCSALQRVIFVDDRPGFYESALGDLKKAIREIRVGSPEDFGTMYGPVINKAAYDRICAVREKAKKIGVEITEGQQKSNMSEGYFIPPFLIDGFRNGYELVQQELFGPGLFILYARTIEEAVEMANDTEYGLTGGICSRNESYLQYARENLIVGNYYENKPIVGARVLCQSFGGVKESGGFGFKAGGNFYLLNFLRDGRAFSQNTMRQGIPLDSR